jgi:hypothetical protein
MSARIAGSVGLLLALAAGAGADMERLRWSREPWGRGAGALRAIAVDAQTGNVAFGDEQGVTLALSGAGGRWFARTAPVADLVFDRGGALWIATGDGLWRRGPGAAAPVVDRSPAPGEAARRVHRLALAGDLLAAASDAGVFASLDGLRWSRVDAAAPGGPAQAVALRSSNANGYELWWLAGASIWRAELERDADIVRVIGVRQEHVVGVPAGVAPVDVLAGSARDGIVVLYPRALALRTAGRTDSIGQTDRGEQADRTGWTIWRPVMPPGTEAKRIDRALGAFWLATDRGLLRSEDLRSVWSRAGMPAGWLATAAVANDGRQLFTASATGVLRGVGEEPTRVSASAPDVLRTPRREPLEDSGLDVRRVQAMALSHLGLDAERSRELRRRASSRSWWPKLDLHVGYGGDRSVRRDFDQTFSSGATHRLFDRDTERGDDWDLALGLRWDLAAAVFDPELIDLAREDRQWISLRDDLLDEVNLLYFERLRVLLELTARADSDAYEAERLRLRAGELAAGLDAWTGGGFTRALAHPDRHQE